MSVERSELNPPENGQALARLGRVEPAGGRASARPPSAGSAPRGGSRVGQVCDLTLVGVEPTDEGARVAAFACAVCFGQVKDLTYLG